MSPRKQALLTAVVSAMASRKPSADDLRLIADCWEKAPKTAKWCQNLAKKVRSNVDRNMLATWQQTLSDELVQD